MGKRYVYWRTPTGQPYKKNDGKYAPVALLAKIGESATVNDDGNISWPFPDLQQDRLAVRSATVVLGPDGNELNETDKWSIVSEATKKVTEKQGIGRPIRASDFIASADRLAGAYFRRRLDDYVLVSSLSVERLPARTIRIRDCEVSGLASRGKFAVPNALTLRRYDAPFAEHLKSTKYLTIRVRTSGRSVFDATDNALDAINLLRGLWTLFSTHGRWAMRMGSTRQKAIGVIHAGPVHTLHNLDGSPAVDLFWYEPGYSGDTKLFKPSNGWQRLDTVRRRASRRLKRHPFRREVERLVMRYAEALDQTELDLAFLRMWSILEKITDTIGSDYNKTIRRATWGFEDRRSAKEKLGYLRMRRNQFVHNARNSAHADQVVQLVKSFVDPHLTNLIWNTLEVDSIAEYGSFLGLPTNTSALEKRHDQIKRAIRIRERRERS